MACMKNCYEGTNYAKRNVNVEGSLEYVTIMAQKFSDITESSIIIYKRKLTGYGEFYDFEPISEERKDYIKLIRFNKKSASKDILRDSGNRKSKPVKSKKGKSKPTKVADNLGDDKGGLLQDEQPEAVRS